MQDSRKLLTLDDIPFDGKRVVVRVDFNVTTSKKDVVSAHEDYRMVCALKTITELQQRRCKILLLAHRGRPRDINLSFSRSGFDMDPIRRHLEDLLQEDVRVLPKLFGAQVESIVESMEPGSVAMYPNVRLDARERSASEKFGKDIVQHADAYVNEAFSVCHRSHTSVSVLPHLLPSAAGRRTVQEVEILSGLRCNVKKPYVAIVSGSKITTKIGMLRYLLSQVDTLCVGGVIANVFLAAQGVWPEEKFSSDDVAAAKSLIKDAGDKLVIPVDVVVGSSDGTDSMVVDVNDLDPSVEGVWDIGPLSVQRIIDACLGAGTVMWNGPVGKWEVKEYSQSTKKIVMALSDGTAFRVVGGGDTVNALHTYGVVNQYDHVSVGGGAMVAFLEGKRMPGLEPLYE